MDEEKSKEDENTEDKAEEKDSVPEVKENEMVKPVEKVVDSFSGKGFTEKMREKPWMIATCVLGIVVVMLLLFDGGGNMTANVISEDDAGEKLVDFLSQRSDSEIVLSDVTALSGLYKVDIEYEGDIIPLYVTQDGQFFVQSVIPISDSADSGGQQQAPQDIPKSNKPKVELFVMTHCPYGAQAEKGFIPVIEALGNNIDAEIKFIHYFMHQGEETETSIQVCIREEQSGKYLKYLECFLEDGNSDRCLGVAGIDKSKLNSCVSDKADSYYAEDSEISQGYNVQGSPTLIINGVIANSGRSPAGFLSTICSAFNNAPSECDQELSSASPSPGFGGGTGADTDASC